MQVTDLRPAAAVAPAGDPAPGRWGWRRMLPAILVLALVCRIAIIVATPHFALLGDPADYQRHAVSIAYGYGVPTTEIATPGTASAFRPPAYPYLLGGVYAVFGVRLNLARVLGALLGVLAVALIAYLGRRLWSERVGLLAAALAASFLPLIELNATLLPESLFIPLELGFLLAVAASTRAPDRLRWPILAGALCAAATLTRAVADAWLLVGFAVALTSGAPMRARARSLLALIAAFAVVVLPWTVRNAMRFTRSCRSPPKVDIRSPGSTTRRRRRTAYWRRCGATREGYQASSRCSTRCTCAPGGNGEQVDGALRHAGVSYIENHPDYVARVMWLDTLRIFDLGAAHTFTTDIAYQDLDLPSGLRRPTTLMAQVLAVLAIVGLVGLVARLTRRLQFPLGPWWLWATAALTLILSVAMVGNPRKRVPLDPFLLLLIAAAIVSSVERWRTSRRSVSVRGAGGW